MARKHRNGPDLADYMAAGYPVLFMRTVEPHVAENKVRDAITDDLQIDHKTQFGVWKATTGLAVGRASQPSTMQSRGGGDFIDGLRFIGTADADHPAVVVFHNVRQFINHYQNIQMLVDISHEARLSGSTVILVGPHIELPPELRNIVTYVEVPLPSQAQITAQYAELIRSYSDEVTLPKSKEQRSQLITEAARAAIGLDSLGAENALALSLATAEQIDIKIIQQQKEQEVRKSDVLEFFSHGETINDVGGFAYFKEWLTRRSKAFTQAARDYGLPYPKGMLIVGPAGCLAASTVLPFRRGNRNSGRHVTVEDAHYKFNGLARDGGRSGSQYLWDRSLPTQTLCVLDGDVIGYSDISDIVYSGVKETFTVTVESNRSIRVTAEHPFKTPGGEYVPLSSLAVRDSVLMRDMGGGEGRKIFSDNRKVVESVPYHPHAWDHWIGYESYGDPVERNYKRIHYARLVAEAAMNDIPVEKLIKILRTDPVAAATLQYLSPDVVIHHKNFKEDDDRPENLEPMSKADHDTLHGEYHRRNMRYSTLAPEEIVSIEPYGEEETYDIVMTNPYRNYVAQGFAVHNTGKSLVAKASASYLRLPLLRLDMGKIFRSLVGESEAAIRMALQVAEAVSPVVLWMDEIDKGLAGARGSGELDSGVSARVVSTILTWRQETTYPVLLTATANDVTTLPAMVYRKGRLDEVWATDLPTVAERVEIFSIHLRKRKRDPEKFKVELLAKKTPDFTGAEIEGCIEDAMFTAFDKDEEVETEHVLASISETVPQAKRNREELEAIREWAATRARKVAGGEPAEQSPAGKKSKVRNIHIKKK